jgi:hypothetical protein
MITMVSPALVGTLMPGIGGTMRARASQWLTAPTVALSTIVAPAHEERLGAKGANKAVERDLVHPLKRQDENWTSAG